jgi:integrase
MAAKHKKDPPGRKPGHYVRVDHGGDTSWKSFGRDRLAATRFASETNVAIARGKFKMPSSDGRKSLLSYAKEVLEHQDSRKESSQGQYLAHAENHLYGADIMKLAVGAVTRSHVETYVRGLTLLDGKPMSPKFREIMLTILGNVFTKAVQSEVIDKNPCDGVRSVISRTNEELSDEDGPVVVLTQHQAEIELLNEIRDLKGFMMWAFFFILYRMGLRSGELRALKNDSIFWSDKDTKGYVWVRRSITYVPKRKGSAVEGGEKIGTPKTKMSKRRVDMSPSVEAVLRKVVGDRPPEAFTFPGKTAGGWMAYSYISNIWNQVAAKAGIIGVGPHVLRHSFASMMLAQGKRLKYVSQQLGHANVSITDRIYGHLMPGDANNTTDVFGDAPAQTLALVVGNVIPAVLVGYVDAHLGADDSGEPSKEQ